MTARRSLLLALAVATGLGAGVAHADMNPINETGVIRVDGADRYEVSAKVSAKVTTPPQKFVIIASGEVFADALAAGPAASLLRAPILLVRKNVVPPQVAAELQRVAPEQIYLMGGPNTISGATEQALADLTGAKITRFGGADRYAVAAYISRGFSSINTVYIASGEVFSDALSAGPAASKQGGAILLARRESLPQPTLDVLTSRAPARVVIVGGPATISPLVQGQIEAAVPHATVVRYEGADRYEVAANVARAVWPSGAAKAFYASGEKFPDALAGTPAAAVNDAPTLLTTASCTPYATRKWTEDVAPGLQVLLGGTASAYDGTVVCGPAPAYGDFPDDLDCADFPSQREAQRWFDYWSPRVGDIYNLDRDDDGQVCEVWPPQ